MTTKRTTENDLVVSGTAGAAPRRKPARPRAKHSAPPAESSVDSSPMSETAAPVPAETTPIAAEPSHEEIARLAYSYWEARGCQGGSSEEDWLRAEREIRIVAVSTATV